MHVVWATRKRGICEDVQLFRLGPGHGEMPAGGAARGRPVGVSFSLIRSSQLGGLQIAPGPQTCLSLLSSTVQVKCLKSLLKVKFQRRLGDGHAWGHLGKSCRQREQ